MQWDTSSVLLSDDETLAYFMAWEHHFGQILLQVSVETRARVFQFKVLHIILYLNQRLHKMGLAESPLCNLCGISQEITTHLFLNCPITTNLWQTIQRKSCPFLTLPDITVSTVLSIWFFSQSHLTKT